MNGDDDQREEEESKEKGSLEVKAAGELTPEATCIV